jgi:TolB-like protein/DNA-binding SARP family transcriptional activator/Tfp pilus assembly protein PilF
MADEGKSRQGIWASEASLSLFGPVRLTGRNGSDLTPKARKTRAVLAIVALSRSPVPRGRLTDLLWGDRGEEQAKASLRQALYEVRDLSTGGLLNVSRESVALGPKRLWTDIGSLESDSTRRDPAAIAQILSDSSWPPLSDLDDITSELDDWLRDERARLQSLVLQKGAENAEEAIRGGDARSARTIADCLQRIDPLDERLARIGARADVALEDRTAAHRRIARLEEHLRSELGLEISPDTRAFLKQSGSLPEAPLATPADPAETGRRFSRRNALIALALAAIIAIVAAFYFFRPGAAQATPTVAVLPFEDVGQKSQGYFASGVSDEILNLLSHEKQVRVLGRVSAEEIADRPNSLEIARKLGITHLLDGSVRAAGNRVLVIVTLTRVSDGSQLWSERYERRLGDIFAVQGDIASTVASRLSRSFGKPVTQATSPEVYDRYLAARQLVRERREMTLLEADRLLREAIRLDPNYAPAYAELAQEVMLRSDHPTSYGSLPIDRARAEALTLARKAIRLDPNLGDAYAAMGFVDLQDAKSAPYYRKAVELSPQRPEYHRWLATALNQQFRYDEAIVEYRRAIEIDPLWYINYEHLAGALAFLGREQEARQVVQRFLDLSTDDRSKLLLLVGYAKNGFYENRYLRYSQELYRRFPDERNIRFNYASSLSALGERKQAAHLMQFDPLAVALLRGDWNAVAAEAAREGRDFWDRSDLWGAATLLVASGHSDVLVRLYDQTQPLIRSGAIDMELVAVPATVLALRQKGRNAEANRLLQTFAGYNAKFPPRGIGGLVKQMNAAATAALTGRNDEAIRLLDNVSRQQPLALDPFPAWSLVHSPYFSAFKDDPRLAQIDERLRSAVNAERKKAGLSPIARAAWVSNPQTLLTMN